MKAILMILVLAICAQVCWSGEASHVKRSLSETPGEYGEVHEAGSLISVPEVEQFSVESEGGTGEESTAGNHTQEEEGKEEYHEKAQFGSFRFWVFSATSIFLVLLAGLMSGLTVGYLSIDELVLEMKLKNGTEEEKRQAGILLEILKQHHLLLCTLLLANAAAMEALPICLDQLVNEIMAIALSVTAVLIVGEILPQAICTGPDQMRIASFVAPLVRTLMMMEAFIAYPISKALDCVLGEHHIDRYSNEEIHTLIELHSVSEMRKIEEGKEESEHPAAVGLNVEQTRLIRGAIEFPKCTAREIMRPYDQVSTLNINDKLTQAYMRKLRQLGFSRYPVHKGNPHKVIGILLVKKLLGMTSLGMTLEELGVPLRKPIIAHPNKLLTELLVEFQNGRSHIALVTEQDVQLQRFMSEPGGKKSAGKSSVGPKPEIRIMGIVTLEDVVEKAFGADIMDEDDYDNTNPKNNAGKAVSKLSESLYRMVSGSALGLQSGERPLQRSITGSSGGGATLRFHRAPAANDKAQPLLDVK